MGQITKYKNLRLIKRDDKEDMSFLEFVDENQQQVKLSAMGTQENPLPDFVREDGDFDADGEDYYSEAKGKTYHNLAPVWAGRKKIGWKIRVAGETVEPEGIQPKAKPAVKAAPQAARPAAPSTPRVNADDARERYWREREEFERSKDPKITRMSCLSSACQIVQALTSQGKITNASQAREVAELLAKDFEVFVVTGKTEVPATPPPPTILPAAPEKNAKLPTK